MRATLREVAEASLHDPRQAILDRVGDLANIDVFHNQVLGATFIKPPRIMKGPNGENIQFHSTDKGQLEDRFQGKAFLVLKTGPLAFKDDKVASFGGMTVEPGDWIMARPGDGLEFFLGNGKEGLPCRLFDDISVKARISDPALIY